MPSRTFIAKEGSQCMTSKLQRTDWLLLGATDADNLKLKPMLIYHPQNTKYPKPKLCSINGTTKLGWQHICWQHALLDLSSLLRSTTQNKKKFLSNRKRDCSLIMCLIMQELRWRYTMRVMLFSSANTITILQPMDQESFPLSILII